MDYQGIIMNVRRGHFYWEVQWPKEDWMVWIKLGL